MLFITSRRGRKQEALPREGGTPVLALLSVEGEEHYQDSANEVGKCLFGNEGESL